MVVVVGAGQISSLQLYQHILQISIVIKRANSEANSEVLQIFFHKYAIICESVYIIMQFGYISIKSYNQPLVTLS